MIYRMEDYYIRQRIGRSTPTGTYETTRNGHKKPVYKFYEFYKTNAGEFTPERWISVMRECVEAAGAQELLQRIIYHVERNCVWLKNDKEREEHAMEILAGRIYKQGHAWSDFPYDDMEEHTAFIFDFSGVAI